MVEQIAIEINDYTSTTDTNEEDRSVKKQFTVNTNSDMSVFPETHLQEHHSRINDHNNTTDTNEEDRSVKKEFTVNTNSDMSVFPETHLQEHHSRINDHNSTTDTNEEDRSVKKQFTVNTNSDMSVFPETHLQEHHSRINGHNSTTDTNEEDRSVKKEFTVNTNSDMSVFPETHLQEHHSRINDHNSTTDTNEEDRSVKKEFTVNTNSDMSVFPETHLQERHSRINDHNSTTDTNEEDRSVKKQCAVFRIQEHNFCRICKIYGSTIDSGLESSDVQEVTPDIQKQCPSQWSYTELQNIINTSQDIELIEECRYEYHRRQKAYHAWKAEKAHKKLATLQQEPAPQSIGEVVKSMDADLHSHPTTAPPPYPGPPENSNQPFVPGNNGPYSSYTAYPNQSAVTVVHGGTPVVTGVRHIVIANNMSPSPTAYTCPSCNLQIVTRTERKSTLRTHFCAALLCLIACWPCAILPYCMDSCNNIDHYCPNCSAYIGSYVG